MPKKRWDNIEMVPLEESDAFQRPESIAIEIPFADDFEEEECSFLDIVTIDAKQNDLEDRVKRQSVRSDCDHNSLNCGPVTELHIAASEGNVQKVEEILRSGDDPNVRDSFGRSAIFIAAALGHDECLRAMLKVGGDPLAKVRVSEYIVQSAESDYLRRSNGTLQVPMMIWNGRTALHEAARANSPECVEILLEAGADVEAKDAFGATPLLLAGSGLMPDQHSSIVCYEKVVSRLVAAGADGNVHNDGMATSALLNAVYLESVPALKSLLKAKANPGWNNENGGCSTAVHEAAGLGNVDMLRMLLLSDSKEHRLPNIPDNVGRTPLHKAAYAGSRECVSLLLENGADMSLKTVTGVTAVEAIVKHVPESESFLLSLLDSYVSCSACTPKAQNSVIQLNFSLLVPGNYPKQTRVLNALFTAKSISIETKRALLRHPLLEAFVRFKWHILRKYFLGMIIINAFFVSTLSTHVTLKYLHLDGVTGSIDNVSLFITIMRYAHIFSAILVLCEVLMQCRIHFRYYIRQFETWTNGISAVLSLCWVTSISLSEENSFWPLHLISIALPMAWAGIMMLLGRFPIWGSRALLFGVVLRNVFCTLLVLGFMLVGFSFSFFVQFHESNSDAFGNPWNAFVTTIVMMTGEYEYLQIFSKDKVFLPFTSRVLYLTFIVVASIVLINLIVGLAVTDTQAMYSESEARSHYKRTEFVDLLECIVVPIARLCALDKFMKINIHRIPGEKNKAIRKILPKCLVDSLVKLSLRQQKKGNHSSQIPKGRTISIDEEPLDRQLYSIMNNCMKEILEAIKVSKHTNYDQEKEPQKPHTSMKSSRFKAFVDKIIFAQRFSKKIPNHV